MFYSCVSFKKGYHALISFNMKAVVSRFSCSRLHIKVIKVSLSHVHTVPRRSWDPNPDWMEEIVGTTTIGQTKLLKHTPQRI